MAKSRGLTPTPIPEAVKKHTLQQFYYEKTQQHRHQSEVNDSTAKGHVIALTSPPPLSNDRPALLKPDYY